MKRFLAAVVAVVLLLPICAVPSQGASLGRAVVAFDNQRPDREETAWGRLVADALREAGKADVALINAASLRKGTLAAGTVTESNINALLAFPSDAVVTMPLTGAQLRAALERAVQAYPTASSAFLQGSGFTAQFNTQAATNERITLLRIGGREVRDDDVIRTALPLPLAQGGSGYFTIWNAKDAVRINVTVTDAIAGYIRSRGAVTPDTTTRLSPL